MTTTISVTVTCHFCLKVELESYRNCTHEDATNSTPCSLIVTYLVGRFEISMLFPTTLFIALLLQAASTKTIFLKTNDKNVP